MTAGLYDIGGAATVIENLADQLGKKGLDGTVGALSFKRTSQRTFLCSNIIGYNDLTYDFIPYEK